MLNPVSAPNGAAPPAYSDRIGFAQLTRRAFEGGNLHPLREKLLARIAEGTAEAGEGLDLSLIAQLLGEKEAGLVIQTEVLAFHQLFRTPCAAAKPRMRVLALAADIDMGGNTPIEFLLEGSDIELLTLYVVKGVGLPETLPDHDVAIVVASDSAECREALAVMEQAAPRWPRPLLNRPELIGNLDRDKLYRLLADIPGLDIPVTANATRAQLTALSEGRIACAEITDELHFPMIVRPRGTHAGVGLAKVDDAAALKAYLVERQEQDFFVARFVNYASPDGLFRKIRLTIVDGEPYACHMAVADRWDIWYLNAYMAFSEEKRAEEAVFMQDFDHAFAARHRNALDEMSRRVGLDYFIVDCAENQKGELLVFEADNTAVVHNMDPPAVFPYKPPQMRKIFAAFTAMLSRHAKAGEGSAA
ncbi:ATP-grasp domain-containing protein [Bradyrhizobium sp. DASA03120]|uniref:ATP-grasp domain-containing protein n=1 Tax=Bradyrhizobium sp. SMVTL-02 TaxID=3395917 RepID=UPI003F7232B5